MPSPDLDLLNSLLLTPAGPLDDIIVKESVTSTNDELRDHVEHSDQAPGRVMLVARHQQAGKGRAGRQWVTGPDQALTASIYFEPDIPADAMTWLPLIAGYGVVTALRGTYAVPAALKWPNDIVVADPDAPQHAGWSHLRKLGGILVERVGDHGVIVGVGINVHQEVDELPVPTATSLSALGVSDASVTFLLAGIVRACADVFLQFAEANADIMASGLRDEITQSTVTIGSTVVAELPDGSSIDGQAVGLDPRGALLIERDGGNVTAVTSGDVYHLRLK